MAVFGLMFMVVFAGGISLTVFLCALPLLLRRGSEANRFGPRSSVRLPFTAVKSGFARAFDFNGRANRLEFWTFAIFIVMICSVGVMATIALVVINQRHPVWASGIPLLTIPLLVMPSVSMAVRRLHDVNKSGAWLMLLLVFGYFILLYWFVQPSHQGDHQVANVFD